MSGRDIPEDMKSGVFKTIFLLTAWLWMSTAYAYNRYGDWSEPDTILKSGRDSIKQRNLKELTVTAKLESHSGNTDTYFIVEPMLKNLTSAGELLGKLPGIYYNTLDKGLKYLGSDNIALLIDGVEKDPTYIKLLNPKRFAKVSIDNHPVGKYADYDAVINLISKQIYKGYDGLLTADVRLLPNRYNGNGHSLSSERNDFQFTYTRDKWNWSLSGFYSYLDENQTIGYEKIFPLNNYEQKVERPDIQHPNRFNKQNSGQISFWADYSITRDHRLSVGVSISPISNKLDYRTMLISFIGKDSIKSINLERNITPTCIQNIQGVLQYQGFVKGWRLNAETGISRTNYQVEHTIDRYQYHLDDNRKYDMPYSWVGASGEKAMFDGRLRISMYDYAIGARYDMTNAADGILLSHESYFRNRVGGNITYIPNQTWSVGGGIGLYSVRNVWRNFTKSYGLPRAQLSITFSKPDYTMRFNYIATPVYPGMSQIQDYGAFTDTLVYQTGNSALKPSLMHKFNLMAHLFKDLSLSGEYDICHNAIFNIVETGYDPQPYAYMIYRNGSSRSWKVNATYTWNKKAWTLSGTVSLSGQKAEYESYNRSKVLPDYNWYVRYNFTPWNMYVYLSSAVGRSLTIEPQKEGWECVDSYVLSFQKYFLGSRLLLYGMWRLPFHFMKDDWKIRQITPVYVYNEIFGDYRKSQNMINIGFQFRFNGGEKPRQYYRSYQYIAN